MGRELELKYALAPETKAAIELALGPFRPITMETTYYDSKDGSLSARHWTLRRRLENGISVCTLKIPGDNGARGEWEVEAGDISTAIPLLLAAGAPGELTSLTASGLAPSCGARFTRLCTDTAFGGSRIELALDEGILFREDRQCPLLELEAELKSGSDEDLYAFGSVLMNTYPLTPESRSKLSRAKAL